MIVPSATEVAPGDAVHFDVLLFGERIKDPQLNINNTKTSDTTYQFKEEGIYNVYAIGRDGIKNSDTIQVLVGKAQLVLKTSSKKITVGETVSFAAVDRDDTVDADIYVNGTEISGTTYQFKEEGTFKAHAEGDNYRNSDTIHIKVHPENKLILMATSLELIQGEKDTFRVKMNGQHITDAELYVNNQKISDSVYLFDNVGIYKVFVHKSGYENSDTLEIAVNEAQKLQLKALRATQPIADGDTVAMDSIIDLSALYKGTPVASANFYIDGSKIAINNYAITTTGVHKIHAEAPGYTNSDTLELTVLKKLILLQSVNIVQTPGGAPKIIGYSFSATLGEAVPVQDAIIYIDGVKAADPNIVHFTPRAEPYEVYAHKDGYMNSDILLLPIHKPQIKLLSDKDEIYPGMTVHFSAEKPGSGILNDFDMYVDGTKVPGGQKEYTFNSVGTHEVVAKSEDYSDSKPLTITVYDKNFSVYKVGYHGNGTSRKGVYFTPDLQSHTLGTGEVSGIAVTTNKDIYVSGSIWDYNNDIFGVRSWKNGTEQILYDEYGYGLGIGVDNNGNVYEVGQINNGAAYWENGDLTVLTDTSSSVQWEDQRKAVDIAFYNGDVYCVGGSGSNDINPKNRKAIYWKNDGNHATTLSHGNAVGATATAITIKQGDIYIAGTIANSPRDIQTVYWKNGNLTKVGDMSSWRANDIAVSNDGTVYIVGGYFDDMVHPAIWVNNNRYDLDLPINNIDGVATGIAIDPNGLIWVVGSSEDNAEWSYGDVWVVQASTSNGVSVIDHHRVKISSVLMTDGELVDIQIIPD